MSGPTPGPWSADGPDMFGDFNILHGGDALAIGAAVSNMRLEDEVKANAALIAASPCLLEALEAVLDTSGVRKEYHAVKYVEAIEAAERAIAKAKGGAA